ncbi:cache domain-containing sensor histidine kinase [Paenibacillus radicis (ex Gao et al. 2016)]|uniref:Histidine kinase/HSP90-like ATPase domain-containing protein n=1 Tax=Paenibacillus radicis (ex Gao et al. 2016) TaxID=1737354 RepID=A0A917GXV4_9BACL|nr:sensor histidine kinase [Paenibacillus radicis (ex Gao et al. 2016)]GGG61223.1 hypothetical protein GCM10010918_13320 [Paenibacillus radicis (ex Gao et al. 2016)]
MAVRLRKGRSGLLSRLNMPIFLLIVVIIAFFATASSYILIRVQNGHTLQLAEQSMKFVYRNLWYQFDTMNNVSAFIVSNQSIENLLESAHEEPYEAVGDYFTLQTNLQNLSLLSLLNDFGSRDAAQQSYTVSLALEPESGLYGLATEHFDPVTGIFKAGDLHNQSWYRSLSSGEQQTVWWGQATSRPSASMIYSARKKASIKDGRSVGTVIIGANAGSIRSVFNNAPIDKGYHLLLDERRQVIASERYAFLEDVSGLPYVQASSAAKGSIVIRIDGEKHRVMFDTLANGWKLLTVVPESHFSKYTLAISGIGAATAVVALLIAAFWVRRIVVRVTVPITRLVAAMQRPEVAAFKEPLPHPNTGIYEVDELNQKFASMLVTLHGLIEKSFEEEMERRALQLELLHAQINPHFLYNTLDLINCRAIMAGDKETSRIVRSLANVFRYGLNRGQTWILLKEELAQVQSYLHIQQMMNEHLVVELLVPDRLLSASMIHLTLQPLAENAIIHGFAQEDSECRITISARQDGTKLILQVQDNGIGCDVQRMNQLLQEQAPGGERLADAGSSSGSGYGTLNVHRRIQLHCGKAFGLRYVESVKGTCVEVVLPLSSESTDSIRRGG